MTKRAVLYARVSGDDTGKDGRNLAGQLDMCREYAERQGWQVVAELAEDERGVSGARMDAPELNRALDMAEGGAFDVLVVREMDRFARKLAKQLVVEEQFKRAGVAVVYVLEDYNDTPEGRLGKHVRATIAEYEREKTRERTLRGRRRSVMAGNVILHAGGAPYGYRKVEDGGRVRLEVDDNDAAIVRLIFDWYAAGETVRGIARRLTEMGTPTPSDKAGKTVIKKRGAAMWGPSSVDNILNREAYTGTWYYGKYNNHTNERNPKEHYIAVSVPPIVDEATWAQAQARKVQNKVMAARNTRHDYLLRARLTCGRCGASVGTQAIPGREMTYLYYRCNAAKQSQNYVHNCDMPQFRADLWDERVWQWMKDTLANPERLRAQAEGQRARQEEARRPIRNQLDVIEQLLTKHRQQLAKALDVYLEGDMLRELLAERTEQLTARIGALEKERAQLTQQLGADVLTGDQLQSLEAFALAVAARLPAADQDFEKRRALVEMLDLRGRLLLVDGQQAVSLTGHLGESIPLFVSPTWSSKGHKLTFTAHLPTNSADISRATDALPVAFFAHFEGANAM